MCRELWEFAGDGERYNEKIVHSFLPALFAKWREAGTTHTATIVLISRVFYDESEVEYAAGPLRQDDDSRWYKDFFKVITDLEVVYDWKPTLVSLKDSFWAFQRDILLAHHYHRASLASSDSQSQITVATSDGDGTTQATDNVRLVGQLSYAHDGPILEALNLSLNPIETHYIDRSLSLTGSVSIIITPGTGYFRVNKHLLRLTTARLLDQGFALDLVSLTKPPLHQSPIFAFKGFEPEPTSGPGTGSRTLDALWDPDDELRSGMRKMTTFWWEPFWLSVSFWDQQMDLPFREDRCVSPYPLYGSTMRSDDSRTRFVARAKMHEVEMLGLLDHDVLSSIELPCLPDINSDPAATPRPGFMHASFSTLSTTNGTISSTTTNNDKHLTKAEADKFDTDVFSLYQPPTTHIASPMTQRNSLVSLSSEGSHSLRLEGAGGLKRSLSSHTTGSRITTIQESPRQGSGLLPVISPASELAGDADGDKRLSTVASPSITGNTNLLSTSPSQSSVLSGRTVRSSTSTLSAATSSTKVGSTRSATGSSARPLLQKSSATSRFAPSWLWSAFSRSGISQPETSAVSASAGLSSPSITSPLSSAPVASTSQANALARGPLRTRTPSQTSRSQSQAPKPSQAHQIQGPGPQPPFAHRSPKPVAIKAATVGRSGLSRMSPHDEEGLVVPHSRSLTRQSPLTHTPPRDLDNPLYGGVKRRSGTLSSIHPPLVSSSSVSRTNPSKPSAPVPSVQTALARRFEHIFPVPLSKHDIKWLSMITPASLPLATEYFPRPSELEKQYIVSPYDFVVDPPEMRSFLIRPPVVNSNNLEIIRRTWAQAVMRAMVALRLAQGFQFILNPSLLPKGAESSVATLRRTASSYAASDEDMPKLQGAPEALKIASDPVYLSMSNEIHRIAYSGDSIQVRRYVKRVPRLMPYDYQCLIWPKLGVGYTELKTSFVLHGLENYGWNRYVLPLFQND